MARAVEQYIGDKSVTLRAAGLPDYTFYGQIRDIWHFSKQFGINIYFWPLTPYLAPKVKIWPLLLYKVKMEILALENIKVGHLCCFYANYC
jgi:hypothetical protein